MREVNDAFDFGNWLLLHLTVSSVNFFNFIATSLISDHSMQIQVIRDGW